MGVGALVGLLAPTLPPAGAVGVTVTGELTVGAVLEEDGAAALDEGVLVVRAGGVCTTGCCTTPSSIGGTAESEEGTGVETDGRLGGSCSATPLRPPWR